MPRIRTLVSIGLVAWVAAGCSAIKVSVDYDPRASFAGLSTYAWVSEALPANEGVRVTGLLEARVRRSVDAELASRGYVKTSESPSFLVNYDVTVERKTDVRTVGSPYGYSGWYTAYPETYVYQYDQGTLVLDIISADGKTLLWRGSASSVVNPNATPEKREAQVDAAVKKILDRFPPRP